MVKGDYREGLSFQQEWDAVKDRKEDVTTVFVCCWNEWIAQKQSNGAFIDVYNWEYSRDIEMMKGGYGDNFYMQLVKNVREFKYEKGKHYQYITDTVDISDASSEWENASHYKDMEGDVQNRNYKDAAGKSTYTDTSARNDITDISVIHDDKNLYVRVQTAKVIEPYNGYDANWMNLLISTSDKDSVSFEGYEYLINRRPGETTTSIEKSIGGYAWESVGEAAYNVSGNVIMFSIPLAAIGKSVNECSIEFKVSDNVTAPSDIMDYYISGDSAPLGRLNFSYGY